MLYDRIAKRWQILKGEFANWNVDKYWKENLKIWLEPGNAEGQGQRHESKLVFIMALVWSVIDLLIVLPQLT